MTNFDKLTIEIETDGTITPEEALSAAPPRSWSTSSAVRHDRRQAVAVGPQRRRGVPQLPPNMLDMPIEELDLPMRAYNSLKRNNIVKVGQLLQLKDDDLLRMRNFGKKSLDEMKERLAHARLHPPRRPRVRRFDVDGRRTTPFEDDEDEA